MKTKYCPNCKQDIPVTEWHKNSTKPDGLQSHCKNCMRERNLQAYYNMTLSERTARNKQATARNNSRNTQFIIEYLQEHPCVDCGEDDIIVLEFDHVRGGEKKFSISSCTTDKMSLDKLKTEIAKCDVRCANCHRRKTAVTLGWYRASVV